MKAGVIDFNSSAKVITALYLLYLAVAISILLFLGPFSFVTTPTQPVTGSLAIFVSSIVGFRASRLFGGRKNFTGRLVSYYSAALFLEAVSWVVWGLFADGQIPHGLTLIALSIAAVGGTAISAYVLLRSAKAIVIKFDGRVVAIVLIALSLSVVFSILVSVVLTSPVDRFFWSGLYSTLVFLQLVGGLILLTSLGKWYMAKPLVNIAFGYIFYAVATSLLTIIRNAFTAQFPEADYWAVVSFIGATSFYFVGMQMTQVKPRTTAVAPA
jgi:hypothetical protein